MHFSPNILIYKNGSAEPIHAELIDETVMAIDTSTNKENDEFLGWCGLKFTEKLNEYDIGFRFFKKYWNKGYATESAKSCINYGINKLKMTEILGRAMKDNIASIKVLEKIGLQYKKNFDFLCAASLRDF